MNPDPTVRKLVQVAEQTQAPVHVPVLLGNECFIVTQQDVRKIEDSRVFTYSKVNAKGELVPIESNMADANIREALLAATRYQTQFQHQNAMQPLNVNVLAEIMARTYGANTPQQPSMFQANLPDAAQYFPSGTMQATQIIPNVMVASSPQTDYSTALATLQQQVELAKANSNVLTPNQYPLHHTSATSTTEISHSPCYQQQRRQCCTRACNTMEVDEQRSAPAFSHSATCVGARQQAKQRKMTQFAG